MSKMLFPEQKMKPVRKKRKSAHEPRWNHIHSIAEDYIHTRQLKRIQTEWKNRGIIG